jgi:uncharacterized protein YjiS (DUF1127 family)
MKDAADAAALTYERTSQGIEAMTMIVIPRTRSASSSRSGETCVEGMVHAFRRWLTAFRTWKTERVAMAQLQLMSDRELKDIGLVRSEINFAVKDGIARHSVYRRYY